jgi:N-acetylglutamate synthase-like GNAT family acetyltransferase
MGESPQEAEMNRSYPASHPSPKLWAEILITVLGIIGAFIFFALYESAFPDASVDVTISRAQAQQIATEQLEQLGYSMEGYKFALSFSSDSHAAYYLQRTLGIEESNERLEQEEWPIYYWTARWFKPLQKEEFRVYLMPDGKILGLNHIIREDATGKNITQEEAQLLAETFLAQHANWQSVDWERIEASSETQQGGRTDHTFTWKSNKYSAGESELRYTVVVQSDQIGFVDYFIKVPEAFTRKYSSERDVAGFINNIAYLALTLGSLIISMVAIVLSRPDVRRVMIPVLLVAGVSFAAYLNFLPLYKFSYGTTENYPLFWINNVVGILFSVIFSGVQVLVLLVGAQSLSKFVWPRKDRILARGMNRWVEFSRSAWRGLMLGGVQMAYVVLFYVFATNYLEWWSPVTSEYSDIFATPFPFFYAFDVGLGAAVTEELSVRFLGIGFFLWLFRGKYKWLAVLIPSLLWAFAHTGYVSAPIYARGVELTIVALFLGFIFLKFDLTTTIMSHFTYNMMVVGIALLRSSESYYQISGWIVVLTLLLPLMPGIFLTIRRYLRNAHASLENLILSPLEKTDLVQLSAFPVKANWQELAEQVNRTTLCLRAETEIIGVVTGFVDDKLFGYVDGIYVIPKWRRQYWGTTLLDAIREELRNCGATEVRIAVTPGENRTRSFLHNLFWRTNLHILTQDETEQTFRAAVKNLTSDLRKEKPGEFEAEIPRNLI